MAQTSDRRVWSPAQVIAGIAGFLFVVFGGIALARLGFPGSMIDETTEVWGAGFTRTWAVVHIVVGLVLLIAAASAIGVKQWLVTLGFLGAAFGVVVMVEPSTFERTLGATFTTGVAWLVVGLLLVLVAMLSPTITTRHRRDVAEHDVDVA